jgi:uncharacterized membrane protein
MFPLLQNLPAWLALIGWLTLATGVAACLPRLRRGFLPGHSQQHAWLAGVVILALMWTMPPRDEGLGFGLIGSALFTLVFGRERGLLGLLAAALLYTFTAGSWVNLGVNATLLAVVPAWLATALQRRLERLPPNLFIFIIGNGMFVTLLVTAIVSVSFIALAAFADGTPVSGDLFAYSLLLAWGEALLSGMIFSALVVFLPGVVMTYRQDVYLPPRRRGSGS